MYTTHTKFVSGFLITTVFASAMFFALPQNSFAWVEETGNPVDLDTPIEAVSDTPSDAGAGVKASANSTTNSNSTSLLTTCGVKALADYAIAWATGEIKALVAKTDVPATDPTSQTQKVQFDVKACIKAVINTLAKVAFAKFKKRLLDRMTDDIVSWISGNGGKPKFVTDFNSVLKDSADAALGDTLQEIGAGQLCNANLSIQLKLNLQAPPKFSDSVSCTLSKAIGNVAAFGNNFQNGSWLALQELSAPQNNKYGLRLMAFDELDRKQSTKTDAVKTEATGNSGFLSTKLCVKWSVIGQSPLLITASGALGPETVLGTFLAGNDNALINPSKPPAAPPPEVVALIPPGSRINKIECKAEDQKITTPGGTLGTILGNSFSHDPNALINATDLTPYLSAVFDAAFNRLAREGVRGLSNASENLLSRNGRNLPPQTYAEASSTPPGNPNMLNSAQIKKAIKTTLASSTLELTQIQTKIPIVTQLRDTVSSTLSQLIACQNSKLSMTCSATILQQTQISTISAVLDADNTTLETAPSSLADFISTLNDPDSSLTDLALLLSDTSMLENTLATMVQDLIKFEAQLNDLTGNMSSELNKCNATTPTYSCPLPISPPPGGGNASQLRADIKTKLDSASATITQLQARITNLNSAEASLTSKVSDLTECQRFAVIGGSCTSPIQNRELKGLADSLAGINTTLVAAQGQLAGFKAELDNPYLPIANLQTLNGQADGLLTTLNIVSGSIGPLETRINTYNDTILPGQLLYCRANEYTGTGAYICPL